MVAQYSGTALFVEGHITHTHRHSVAYAISYYDEICTYMNLLAVVMVVKSRRISYEINVKLHSIVVRSSIARVVIRILKQQKLRLIKRPVIFPLLLLLCVCGGGDEYLVTECHTHTRMRDLHTPAKIN